MIVTKTSIDELIKTERGIGNITRVLGAIAKAYIPPVTDDSHTNFLWCNTNKHLVVRSIILPDGKTLNVSYHPGHLHIHFEIEGSDSHEHMILLKGNSMSYVQNRAVQILCKLGIDGDEILKHIEFRYPNLNDVNGKIIKLDKTFISEFSNIRTEANNVLTSYIVNNKVIAEMPRVWPYNFDTGIVCNLKNDITQYAGYAPADEAVCNVPYFYNSFYKDGKQIVANNPLEHGEWLTSGWKGAILPVNSFDTTELFLQSAYAFIENSSKEFLNSK